MQDRVFKLLPSKLYILLICVSMLTSVLVFLCLSLTIWVKLAGCLFLLAYAAHLFWSKGLLRGADAITELHYLGDTYGIGKAFHGEKVALRKTLDERARQVYFGIHHVANIALNEKTVSIVKHGKNA